MRRSCEAVYVSTASVRKKAAPAAASLAIIFLDRAADEDDRGGEKSAPQE